MAFRSRTLRRSGLVIAPAIAALALSVVGTSTVTAAARPQSHPVTPAVGMHPHLVSAGAALSTSGQVKFGCQTVRPGRLTCYGPDQIRAAYSIQPLLNAGNDGRGRTIVIVDAYSPTGAASDLAHFDSVWGLPAPNLTIVAPQGGTAWDPTDPNQVGWGEETNLDLQWAHSVAPGAKIVLVQANSSQDADILAATKWAVDNRVGDVISQSFGEAESCVDPTLLAQEHQMFADATRKGITLIASAGDQGSAQPTCDNTSYILSASSPASDPLVLGVGGTSLSADLTTGAYGSETVWNESNPFDSAGGGGYSTVYSRPNYQGDAVQGSARGVPDVSYNGGINNGVLGYLGPQLLGPYAGWYIFGGTSAGSPQWAGLTAIGAQMAHRRLGLLNVTLYDVANSERYGRYFHDITVGDNSYNPVDYPTISIPGYAAGPGWDAASGLGTPIASNLVPFLARSVS